MIIFSFGAFIMLVNYIPKGNKIYIFWLYIQKIIITPDK